MSGIWHGLTITGSCAKTSWRGLRVVFGEAYSQCAEIPETPGNPSQSSMKPSLAGLGVVAESSGSLDRAGRHTSLLNVSCARTSEMENERT